MGGFLFLLTTLGYVNESLFTIHVMPHDTRYTHVH